MKYEIVEVSNRIRVLLENLRGYVWKKKYIKKIKRDWKKFRKSR